MKSELLFPKTSELIDFSATSAGELLKKFEYPWDAIPKIGDIIAEISETLDESLYERIGENVWIAKNAKVATSASVNGPAIICEGAEIRQCAYIRGNALIGKFSVVGNSCEVKNAIICDNVQIPHFNYVGDSILGRGSHLGAGAVASNFRLDRKSIKIGSGDEKLETGLRKMGVVLGDFSEVGCNSVIFPGTVIGRNTLVYPLTRVRGIVPADSIVKDEKTIILRSKEE